MKTRRAWILLAALLVVWGVSVAIFGGVLLEWHGWRFSARTPLRPFLLAVLVVGYAWWRYGSEGVRRDLAAISGDVDFDRWSRAIALILAVAVLGVGLIWGTRIAGGSDSYGYVSQSRLWAHGNLVVSQPIARKVPWPDADWTFTPLGYKPAPAGGAIVPMYAPGLPILMAALSLIQPDGVFWVVPLAGAALVALSFLLGRALGGPAAGLLTAALMATSPAFLFQLMAPMSDVVVAAFWVAALVLAFPNRRGRWLVAGLASSLAILTRPNTAPIAAVFVLAALWKDNAEEGRASNRRQRIMNGLAYTAGTLPGVLGVAAIHTALYGSPFQSGYGSAGEQFALQNLVPNLARYPTWLVVSETPFVCLAVALPVLARGHGLNRRLAVFAALSAAATWLCYLFFQPFDAWWFLRFLLPAFACQLALAAVAFIRLLQALDIDWRMPVAVAVLAPVLMLRIDYAIAHGTFDAWRYERRYADTGRLVMSTLEPNAVLFSGQQSGSLRYYSGRLTLRWGYLDPAWLDRSIGVLKELGLEPYFVFEEGEEAEFRDRFGTVSRLGRLDWPAHLELKSHPRVRIYDPDDSSDTSLSAFSVLSMSGTCPSPRRRTSPSRDRRFPRRAACSSGRTFGRPWRTRLLTPATGWDWPR